MIRILQATCESRLFFLYIPHPYPHPVPPPTLGQRRHLRTLVGHLMIKV